MTVSFPLTLPSSPNPERMTIIPRERVASARSPFTDVTQMQELQGGHWVAQIALPVLLEDEWREWSAFLTALRGIRGTFIMGDPVRETPAGAGGGTPVVDGAGQTGLTLATRGWLASTLVLKAGDMFQLGSLSAPRLYMVTQDATSDSSGNVTLDLWPRLRASPSDGDSVITDSPKGLFRLKTNENGWNYQPARLAQIDIDCVEAL